eukprot:c7343_g2_i1.p1 GENE.c7343_g2_i1~~c7343_g2_i1.p1  ORF type:complete len:271 (+),score=54.26 c7343_g2_i1:1-813(+)
MGILRMEDTKPLIGSTQTRSMNRPKSIAVLGFLLIALSYVLLLALDDSQHIAFVVLYVIASVLLATGIFVLKSAYFYTFAFGIATAATLILVYVVDPKYTSVCIIPILLQVGFVVLSIFGGDETSTGEDKPLSIGRHPSKTVAVYGEKRNDVNDALQKYLNVQTVPSNGEVSIVVYSTSARSQLSELLKLMATIPGQGAIAVIQLFADRNHTILDQSDFYASQPRVTSVIALRYLIGEDSVPFTPQHADGPTNLRELQSLARDCQISLRT